MASSNLNTPNVGSVAYLWSDGFTLKDRYAMAPGTYTVTLTNDMGCQTIDTTILTNQGNDIHYAIQIQNLTSCTEANGMISLDTTSNTQKNKHPLVNRRKYYPTQLSKGRHLLLHSHRCSWLCCNRQCHYCQCSGLS